MLLLLSFGRIHETIFDTLAFGSFPKIDQAKKRADANKNRLPSFYRVCEYFALFLSPKHFFCGAIDI